MRVLFISGREPTYIRNRLILKALKSQAEVVEITSRSPNFMVRNVSVLVKFLLNRSSYDLLFVGFYGHPLMLWLRRLTETPIIFDAYLSTYDTLCFDREWFSPRSFLGKLAFSLDKHTCNLADRVLLDTKAHQAYFVETFELPPQKFSVLYVGADESIFHPLPALKEGAFLVFYHSSFRPLHGVEHIIRAAESLRDHDVRFLIVGDGPLRSKILRLAERRGLSNVDFLGWVSLTQLPTLIAQASLCLGGHFSDSAKARRVIATKTYQFLAMAKPTIVGDNAANRELFTHGKEVYICPPADGEALAQAILELKEDGALRRKIAWEGYLLFKQRCDTEVIAREMQKIIRATYEDLSS